MSNKSEILKLLEANRGRYISGEEMANHLSVSRNAVWKSIKTLKEDGYLIEAMTHRGYCLSEANDILSSEGIAPHLNQGILYNQIHVFNSIDSTNRHAKELAMAGADQGTVVIANQQLGGRGRKGREFYSPPGHGIYMSMILRPKLAMNQAMLITAAAAVLVAQSLESVKHCQVQIKWVNDLYLEKRKICGILTEAVSDWENGSLQHIILGIGINVSPVLGGFPSELKAIAGTLFKEHEISIHRNYLTAIIINKILAFCHDLEEKPIITAKKIIEEYRSRSCILNKKIQIIDHPELKEGVVINIDKQGFLVVRDALGKQHVLSSGEISIRPDKLEKGEKVYKMLKYTKTRSLILCSLFAALTAVGAFIRIPMPYFDFITLQTLFVLLAGMLLGAKRGALALAVYVLIGLAGVPVFAGGGGITYVLRPSFGFLIGFILGAGGTGWLAAQQKKPSYISLTVAGLVGLLLIYTCGILYRYIIMNYYLQTPMSLWLIIAACIPVEIPKDILICFISAYLAKRIKPLIS